MMKTDLDELVRRLDPSFVLRMIGYEKSSPKFRGQHIRDFCPIHGGDTQRSLVISNSNGGFFCHSCGAKGGLVDLYRMAKNLSISDAFKELSGVSHLSPTPNRKEDKIKDLENSKKIANEIWIKCSDAGNDRYFIAKGLKTPAGLRYRKDEKRDYVIVVPYYDISGDLQCLQHVTTESKLFSSGTSVEGAFFRLGWNGIDQVSKIYIAEGVATACAIYEALDGKEVVVSCGPSQNVPKVTKALWRKYPSAILIVCLDNDPPGKQVGQAVMNFASLRINTCLPDFSGIEPKVNDKGKKYKDFDDLLRLGGKEVVLRCLQG